jgi:hypothetical protein
VSSEPALVDVEAAHDQAAGEDSHVVSLVEPGAELTGRVHLPTHRLGVRHVRIADHLDPTIAVEKGGHRRYEVEQLHGAIRGHGQREDQIHGVGWSVASDLGTVHAHDRHLGGLVHGEEAILPQGGPREHDSGQLGQGHDVEPVDHRVVVIHRDRDAGVVDNLLLDGAEQGADQPCQIGLGCDLRAEVTVSRGEGGLLSGDRVAVAIQVGKPDIDGRRGMGRRLQVHRVLTGLLPNHDDFGSSVAKPDGNLLGEVGADELEQLSAYRRSPIDRDAAQGRNGHQRPPSLLRTISLKQFHKVTFLETALFCRNRSQECIDEQPRSWRTCK